MTTPQLCKNCKHMFKPYTDAPPEHWKCKAFLKSTVNTSFISGDFSKEARFCDNIRTGPLCHKFKQKTSLWYRFKKWASTPKQDDTSQTLSSSVNIV